MVWMSVSEAQWYVNRNSEGKRFVKAIVSKPRNEHRRCSGTDQPDRHHSNVKNIAEHTSRIELGHACIAGDPHAMRNESEKDYRCLRSRSAEIAGDDADAENDEGDPPDGVRTSSPVLCGRNSQGQP